MSSATSTFLKGMYGGVMPGGAGAYPTNRYVFPLGTNNKTDLTMHEGVMKPFCRGCHMTSVGAASRQRARRPPIRRALRCRCQRYGRVAMIFATSRYSLKKVSSEKIAPLWKVPACWGWSSIR